MMTRLRYLAAAQRTGLSLFAVSCLVALSVVPIAMAAAPTPTWPAVSLPEHARGFRVGDQIGLNGVPMRVEGFLIDESPQHVAEWFRHSLSEPLAESVSGKKLILGRPQGEFYLTVQLEAAGGGTRGIVAISDIKTALVRRSETREFGNRWQARLPAGTRVLSQSSSEDAGRISSQMVFLNGLSSDFNRDRIEALLTDDGYALERDTEVIEGRHVAASAVGSHVMRFKGLSKEATAVITRMQDGRTAIVLSTVTQVERMQ